MHFGNGNDQLRSIIPGAVVAGSGNDRIAIELGGDDRIELDDASNHALDGAQGNDKLVIDPASSATTCLRIERVVDWGGHTAVCH